MSKPLRRAPAAIAPMPRELDAEAHYSVRDQSGRTTRAGPLEPGTDLWKQLREVHREFARRGYLVGKLRDGQWAFPATKGKQRLTIAIQQGIPAAISPDLEAASTEPLSEDKAPLQ